MVFLHQFFLFLHILVGSAALFIFWVPVIARKGSFNHRRFGRYFVNAMYLVAGSGIVMSTYDLLFPLAAHAPGSVLSAEESLALIQEVRTLALFLFSLSLLVLVSARQGVLAIIDQGSRNRLRSGWHTALCAVLLITGGVTLGTGFVSGTTLLMLFGGLEVFIALSSLHYSFKTTLSTREWWIEHLGGLIAAGIGAYTAFFVFGGRRLLSGIFAENLAALSLLLWTAPTVIGVCAIIILSRHYRRKFGA